MIKSVIIIVVTLEMWWILVQRLSLYAVVLWPLFLLSYCLILIALNAVGRRVVA